MRKSKVALLLVFMLCLSVTLSGCAGSLGTIFSGLMDGFMACFGDIFTSQGFGQFLGQVAGRATPALSNAAMSGDGVSDADMWGALGQGAAGWAGDRVKTTGKDWGQRWWKTNKNEVLGKKNEAITDPAPSGGNDPATSMPPTDSGTGPTNTPQIMTV